MAGTLPRETQVELNVRSVEGEVVKIEAVSLPQETQNLNFRSIEEAVV